MARVEFLVVALAGLLLGAALGARRVGAPRVVTVGFLVLAGAATVVAVVLLATTSHP